MNLIFDPKKTISDIRNEFQREFPLLDLKFYRKRHSHFGGSKKDEEFDDEIQLIALNLRSENNIHIESSMTVDELESLVENQLGIHVQVFRKSGDTWLQTASTDNWSLEKQMEKAQQAEKSLLDNKN